MTIAITGYSHLRLTVTDLARSRAFYEGLFGWKVAYELPPDADAATTQALWFLFGGVIYEVPGGLLGLRPVGRSGDQFEEDRVGLDHLAFAVASRSDLESAVVQLDAQSVPHGEIKDLGVAHLLEFRDPDGIALELYAPAH